MVRLLCGTQCGRNGNWNFYWSSCFSFGITLVGWLLFAGRRWTRQNFIWLKLTYIRLNHFLCGTEQWCSLKSEFYCFRTMTFLSLEWIKRCCPATENGLVYKYKERRMGDLAFSLPIWFNSRQWFRTEAKCLGAKGMLDLCLTGMIIMEPNYPITSIKLFCNHKLCQLNFKQLHFTWRVLTTHLQQNSNMIRVISLQRQLLGNLFETFDWIVICYLIPLDLCGRLEEGWR